MKRIFILFLVLCSIPVFSHAQKYAFVDTEYILNKIPTYRSAKEQIDRLSQQYQEEIAQRYSDIERQVKDFQSDRVLLTSELREKKQKAILDAEAEVKGLQEKYFGRDGLLFKKQEELLKPIQDQVYQAVKDLANEGGYACVFDVASSPSILYSSARYDKSDEVLRKMGYN